VSEIVSAAPLEKLTANRKIKRIYMVWHVRMSDHIPR
jgi:hypothetical protein